MVSPVEDGKLVEQGLREAKGEVQEEWSASRKQSEPATLREPPQFGDKSRLHSSSSLRQAPVI